MDNAENAAGEVCEREEETPKQKGDIQNEQARKELREADERFWGSRRKRPEAQLQLDGGHEAAAGLARRDASTSFAQGCFTRSTTCRPAGR